MRTDLPTGTVTFLFTDVEGSTRLLHALGEEVYAAVLTEHREIVRSACNGTCSGLVRSTCASASTRGRRS